MIKIDYYDEVCDRCGVRNNPSYTSHLIRKVVMYGGYEVRLCRQCKNEYVDHIGKTGIWLRKAENDADILLSESAVAHGANVIATRLAAMYTKRYELRFEGREIAAEFMRKDAK